MATIKVASKESNLVSVDELPSWIKTSEFVEQFEIDFPGQPIELPPERNFPFPTKVDEGNLETLLDNIRFFGVRDSDIMKQIFKFLIQEFVIGEYVEGLKSSFEELSLIWNNVLFARQYMNVFFFFATGLQKGIYSCVWNMLMKMDVHGMKLYAPMLLVVVILIA
jgi:hypothetical protein